MRKTQVALDASSTIVRKYLCPVVVGIENGPQTSMWTRSNEWTALLLSKGKGGLFFFAKWHTIQYLVQQFCKRGKRWPKEWSFISNGCSNLECHREYKLAWETEEENAVKELNLFLRRKSSRDLEAFERLDACNR